MKIVFIESDPQYVLGLPAGFQKQGCQVKVLNDIVEEELHQVFREYPPDLVVTTGWTRIHTKDNLVTLGRLKKMYGVKHAYWATEDPRWTDKWSLPYVEATCPDYVFTIDRDSVPFYRERGYRACYLPWACNPDFHRPAAQRETYRCDIALVATGAVLETFTPGKHLAVTRSAGETLEMVDYYLRGAITNKNKNLFLPVYENPVSKLSESNLKIIQIIRELLNIKTPMVKVSEFPDIEGKKGTKIVNICKFFGRGTSACLGLAPAVTMMKRNLKEINCPWFTRTLNTPFIRSSGVTSYPICPRWTFSLTVGLRAGIICPGR